MTGKPRTTDDEQARAATVAAIRAAVDQLTRPVRVVERYRIDPTRAPYLAEHDAGPSIRAKSKRDRRTHVQHVPSILDQLAVAIEREKTTAKSGGGGSFKSRPAIELGPVDVAALIRTEARELLHAATGRDIRVEVFKLRSRLTAAHGHVRRHERAATRHRANRVWDLACVAVHASDVELEPAARHLDNLRDRSREATAAAEQWRDQIERINAELGVAESARAPLLAIAAAADHLGPHHLARADHATARWLDLARLASRYDPEPITVSEPCPICGRANSIEIRGDATSSSARCTAEDCDAAFTPDQMATFRRLIREQRNLTTLASDQATPDVDQALDTIEAGRVAADLSKAELARRAGVTRTHVAQVLNRRWPASTELLSTMARVVNDALPAGASS